MDGSHTDCPVGIALFSFATTGYCFSKHHLHGPRADASYHKYSPNQNFKDDHTHQGTSCHSQKCPMATQDSRHIAPPCIVHREQASTCCPLCSVLWSDTEFWIRLFHACGRIWLSIRRETLPSQARTSQSRQIIKLLRLPSRRSSQRPSGRHTCASSQSVSQQWGWMSCHHVSPLTVWNKNGRFYIPRIQRILWRTACQCSLEDPRNSGRCARASCSAIQRRVKKLSSLAVPQVYTRDFCFENVLWNLF